MNVYTFLQNEKLLEVNINYSEIMKLLIY